jgi:uncharacterized repeat protein (TIGR01451 family)
VARPDLRVEKTSSSTTVKPDAEISYTIVVSNIGNGAVVDVALSDVLPANTTFVSFTAPTGWNVQTPAAGGAGTATATATLPNLAPGESATFGLVLRVNATAPGGSAISNTAQVSTANEDADLSNNAATWSIEVELTLVLPPPTPPPAPPSPAPGLQIASFRLLHRFSVFRNEFGLFPVDDAAGRIGDLLPGDPGYAAAALARRRVIFGINQRAGTVRKLVLPTGSFYGLYLVQNATSAAFLARNATNRLGRAPQVFFSFQAANPDRFRHMRWLGANTFAFEDLTFGGDKDFNDLVVRIAAARQPTTPRLAR